MAGLGLGLGISSGVNGPGHDAGGVTDNDVRLAQGFEELLEEYS